MEQNINFLQGAYKNMRYVIQIGIVTLLLATLTACGASKADGIGQEDLAVPVQDSLEPLVPKMPPGGPGTGHTGGVTVQAGAWQAGEWSYEPGTELPEPLPPEDEEPEDPFAGEIPDGPYQHLAGEWIFEEGMVTIQENSDWNLAEGVYALEEEFPSFKTNLLIHKDSRIYYSWRSGGVDLPDRIGSMSGFGSLVQVLPTEGCESTFVWEEEDDCFHQAWMTPLGPDRIWVREAVYAGSYYEPEELLVQRDLLYLRKGTKPFVLDDVDMTQEE